MPRGGKREGAGRPPGTRGVPASERKGERIAMRLTRSERAKLNTIDPSPTVAIRELIARIP
jgi:hypothetical protein